MQFQGLQRLSLLFRPVSVLYDKIENLYYVLCIIIDCWTLDKLRTFFLLLAWFEMHVILLWVEQNTVSFKCAHHLIHQKVTVVKLLFSFTPLTWCSPLTHAHHCSLHSLSKWSPMGAFKRNVKINFPCVQHISHQNKKKKKLPYKHIDNCWLKHQKVCVMFRF